MEAQPYRWSEVPEVNVVPKLFRRMVNGQNAMVANIRLEKGCHVPVHDHSNEQIAVLLSGKVEWTIGPEGDERKVVMSGGEFLVIPPHARHGLTALEDTNIIDILSPVGPMGIDTKEVQEKAVAL